jgi:NAD(P)H-flavin reductase
MGGYKNILMVASGFGIAAQLPYLKRLIHGYNARQLCARRVHLVWQVRDIRKSLCLTVLTVKQSDKARRHNCSPNATQWRIGRGYTG